MFGSLRKKLEETAAQINPFDGGKTAATVRANRNQAPPAQTIRSQPKQNSLVGKNDNQPGFQITNNSFTRGLSRGFDQINPLDNNRTWQQRTPTGTQSIGQEVKRIANTPSTPQKYWDNGVGKAVNTAIAGTNRAAAGIGQDVGGFVDLVTPGKGTNRVTNYFKDRGAMWDEKAKEAGVDGLGYKVSQVPLNVASYMVPGSVAKGVGAMPRVATTTAKVSNIASKTPVVGEVINAGGKLSTKLDDVIKGGNLAQRVGAKLAKSYVSKPGMADVGADVLQNAGHRTSLGQDNSLGTAALDTALSLGTQGVFNLGGQALKPVTTRLVNTAWNLPSPGQVTTRLVKNTVNAVRNIPNPNITTRLAGASRKIDETLFTPRLNRLDLDTRDALIAYSDRLVGADPNIYGKVESDLISKVRAIGDANGVDLTNGTVVQQLDRIEALLNGYKGSSGALNSKPVPVDPLEALKQEARKYKSAEEFVKANSQTPMTGRATYVNGRNKDIAAGSIVKTTLSDGEYVVKSATPEGVYVIRKELIDAGIPEDQMPSPMRINPNEIVDTPVKVSGDVRTLKDKLADAGITSEKQLTDLYNQATAPKTKGVAPQPTKVTKPKTPFESSLEQAGIKPTSSDSSLATSPELSASSPRSSDLKTKSKNLPEVKTPSQKRSNLQPTGSQSLSTNTTPSTREVKLNTKRLNPDSGYAGMAEMDKRTTEIVDKLSNKEITRIAKDAGIDKKTHSTEQIKKKIAEQLNVRQDAVRYMNEAEVARKAGDFDLAEQSMLKAAEAGRISRAQGSELGQQLQARRIIANELDTPQQRIFKLLDAAGVNPEAYVNRLREVDFTDAKQVVEAYRDLVPAKKAQWLDTVRYNSMLSSPLTQAVNIFGNAQGVLGVAPIEKTLRGVYDVIGSTFGKERRYAAGEGLAYSKGSITNIRNATRNFRDALQGTGKYANPDLEEYSIPLATKGVSGAAYKGLSFPMRVLDGMDKFFRTMAESGEESALELRAKKGIKLGGNKEALMEKEAAYRVFQQDLKEPGQGVLSNAADEFASLVMSGRNSKNPVVSTISKFTVPFVKTINNINKQGIIEYSPLGVVNMVGNTDKTTALARATMGTAVFGLSATMVGSGNMTWAEPRDPEERARFRSEGKQPYAVKFGDKWVNFSKLHPAISFPMAMTAALDDAMKAKKMDQGNVDAILEAVSKYGNFLSDQSYAKSVGDALGAVGGDKEAVARMWSNNIQQLVPMRAFTGWIARMTDDLERKVDTSQSYFDQQVQQLMQQYPGLRQKTPTRDYRGEPIPANNPYFNAFSPVRVTNDRGVNPVDAQMDLIKESTEKDPLLDKKQTGEVDKRVSKLLPKAQEALINDPAFQKLSDSDKKSRLTKLSSDIKAVERRKYMAENQVGEYAQNFTGKQAKLTKDQKAMLSGGTDMSKYTTSSDTPTTYKEKYETLKSELNDSSNGWSEVKKATKQKELRKLEIQKDYDEDTVSLHGMSKADMYDFVKNAPNGKELEQKLLAYDQALYDAGLSQYRKYRNGLAPAKSGRKGGGRKGRSKAGYDYAKALFDANVGSVSMTKDLQSILEKYMKANAKSSKKA